MFKITFNSDGTRTISRDGREISRAEFRAWEKKRMSLTGGVAEIFRSRCAPVVDDDETHVRINRSGMSDHEKAHVARRAKALGLNEHVAYDPTVPKVQVYESRKQVDAAIQQAREEADLQGDRPYHRLHPQLVQEIKQARIRQDPSLAHRDQRELEEEIIETHSLPE